MRTINDLKKELIPLIEQILKELKPLKKNFEQYNVWKKLIYWQKILDYSFILSFFGYDKFEKFLKRNKKRTKNYKKAFSTFKTHFEKLNKK